MRYLHHRLLPTLIKITQSIWSSYVLMATTFVKTVLHVRTVEPYLKVDGVEGICNSSVAMLSCHLEGQSGSDHIQRVGAYHCSHPCKHIIYFFFQGLLTHNKKAWHFTCIIMNDVYERKHCLWLNRSKKKSNKFTNDQYICTRQVRGRVLCQRGTRYPTVNGRTGKSYQWERWLTCHRSCHEAVDVSRDPNLFA